MESTNGSSPLNQLRNLQKTLKFTNSSANVAISGQSNSMVQLAGVKGLPGFGQIMPNATVKDVVRTPAADTSTTPLSTLPELEFHAILGSKDNIISGLQSHNAKLSSNIGYLGNNCHKLQTENQQIKERAMQLQNELTAERKKLQDAEKSLSFKDTVISGLQQQNASLSGHTKYLGNELYKMQTLNQQEKDRAQQLESELKAARKKLQETEVCLRSSEGDVLPEQKDSTDEVIKLKQIIENLQMEHESELALLHDKQIRTGKGQRDAIRRADQLKVNLISEKKKAGENEICLAKQMEEMSVLQATLLQTEKDFDEQKQQWEREKRRLLTNKQDAAEVEKLKAQLESQKVTHGVEVSALYNELIKRKKDHQVAVKKAEELEKNLAEVKNRAKEAEDCLAKQTEEISTLQAALIQTETALANQKQQWELEKSHLMTSQHQRDEVEQLKKQLELQKAEAEVEKAALHLTQQKMKQCHEDAAKKATELQMTLRAEKANHIETMTSVVEKIRESFKLKSALVEMEQDMEKQKNLWDQERLRLLEQQETLRNEKAAMKDGLLNERQEWQSEKTCLQEAILAARNALKELQEENMSTESKEDELKNQQEKINNLQGKPDKKTFGRKMKNLFKRSKKQR
ncbi:myosin-11-like [Cyprinodon tularosa]|uniref:myosin-11-like n=1 Tax=Cyprinodon tularosa TaxID=77115 RepID=UPI0018E2496B|nr:myosin-11-like [Cyprinodon tularosa]